MSEFTDETEAYRYILRLAEDLLSHAGIPEELHKKYNLVKDITLNNINLKHEGIYEENNKANVVYKPYIDELVLVFDMIYGSYMTIGEKVNEMLTICSNHDKKLGESCSSRLDSNHLVSYGLIMDHKSVVLNKLRLIKEKRELDLMNDKIALRGSFKSNTIENFLLAQINRFDKNENKVIKTIINLEDSIMKQHSRIFDLEEILDKTQIEEKRLKIELDHIASKLNQMKQSQNTEIVEKNQNLIEQNCRLEETVKKLKQRHEEEKKEIHDHYGRILIDLQEKSKINEKSLNNTLNEMIEKDKATIEKLKDEVINKTNMIENLELVLKGIKLEFTPFYNKYIQTHNQSFDAKKVHNERNNENMETIDFIAYLLQKFENDNLWLVEKLTELGNENEVLKNRIEADVLLREQQRIEFDLLFKQLKHDLQDSKYAFCEWENSVETIKRLLDEEKDQSSILLGSTTKSSRRFE